MVYDRLEDAIREAEKQHTAAKITFARRTKRYVVLSTDGYIVVLYVPDGLRVEYETSGY